MQEGKKEGGGVWGGVWGGVKGFGKGIGGVVCKPAAGMSSSSDLSPSSLMSIRGKYLDLKEKC